MLCGRAFVLNPPPPFCSPLRPPAARISQRHAHPSTLHPGHPPVNLHRVACRLLLALNVGTCVMTARHLHTYLHLHPLLLDAYCCVIQSL